MRGPISEVLVLLLWAIVDWVFFSSFFHCWLCLGLVFWLGLGEV